MERYVAAFTSAQFVARWAVVAVLILPAAAVGQSLDEKSIALLKGMAAAGPAYDASPLHGAGLVGVMDVLDRLLPGTAKSGGDSPVRREVARLIEQLGDDSFRVREAASAELLRLGSVIRPLLTGAAASDDAEVAWRVRRILRHWDETGHRGDRRLMEAFAVYLREVDDQECLDEISRRTAVALGRSGTATGPRWKMLGQCLTAIGRSGNDRIVNRLEPLLAHEDEAVAVRVVEMVAAGSGPSYYPELLLKALAGDRPKVITAAVEAAAFCSDPDRRDELRPLLLRVFEGDDEELRSLCALPLARDFDYAPADNYLLKQLTSKDLQRRDQTLRWIGDPGNLGRPASNKLIAAFEPLLHSEDNSLRRKACAALAIYGGENVVQTLIPLLGDPNASFANEVAYRLDHQRDKAMLRRLVTDAAANHEGERVRTKAAATLKMIERRAKKAEEQAR